MSDRQVSVEGKTYPLVRPFIVLATQNPYEFEGTYVLPESQLDRFMIRLRMGYPIRSERTQGAVPAIAMASRSRLAEPVLDRRRCSRLQRGPAGAGRRRDRGILARYRPCHRRSEDLHVGVSTRGALTLYRAAQSLALVSGRDYVIPDDIKTLAVPVLAHRVVGKSFLQAGEFGAAEAIIRDIVDRARCRFDGADSSVVRTGRPRAMWGDQTDGA